MYFGTKCVKRRRWPVCRKQACDVRFVPCVDGSLLARVFFTVQLVGSGHVFGLFARFT